ncbi:MAG: M56 family metallopeptidase [Bacteroidota bacterium]
MEWLNYLLKVTACTALFYAFYHFYLQRLTFFSVNRAYLLGTLVLSFVIPALQLEVASSAVRSSSPETLRTYTSSFTPAVNPGPVAQYSPVQADEEALAVDWQQVLWVSYWLIAAVMLSLFAYRALQLLRHTRNVNQKIGRLRVVYKEEGFTNCSFLNYVFLNRQELSDEEMAVILHHENVHISRYHSVDKLIVATCKALLWFNPMLYLYDKALTQVHEYEADQETSTAVGSTSYASLLLAIAVRNNNPALAHSFVQNPLKGRIKMLFTNPSKNTRKFMYLAALPIGLGLVWTFAVQVVYASLPVATQKQTESRTSAPKQTPPERTETALKPVGTEKANLPAAVPFKELEVKKPVELTDTLWMLDYRKINRNAEVYIDGKLYDIDILTKISPSCMVSSSYDGKYKITTKDNKIEYATKTDRENALTRDKARASAKPYIRYTQKGQSGKRYDYIEITTKGGSGGGVSVDRGKKLLLIYEGKQYSERQFKALTNDQLIDRSMSFGSFNEADAELTAKYGKGYGAKIEISKPEDVTPADTTSIIK